MKHIWLEKEGEMGMVFKNSAFCEEKKKTKANKVGQFYACS